jgi:glycosyltransferase involved in cell wall biosynthesis
VRCAIVATVRNEAARLPEFFASLERQTVRPDVIVVTDGGSTDRTVDLLRGFAARTSLPFRWAVASGNRSRGRNEAIRLADAEVIAATDVSVLEPRWFERIVAPIERGEADVVAGWFELLVNSARERAIGLLTQWSRDQVRPERFLASSRSIAFTREVWTQAGGYPEAYAGNEDTIFDLALERLHPRKGYVPDAVVHWRPAASVRQVYRQYRKYAVGDGQAAIFLFTGTRYAAHYAVYAGAVLLLIAGIFWWPLWLGLLGGVALYFAFRVRKVAHAGLWSLLPYAILVVLAWDLSRIVGYTAGRIDRLRKGAAHFRF